MTPHQPPEWAVNKGDEIAAEHFFRTELIQVAAVAVAMVECFDRQKYKI